jgi:hypothetical protein
VCDLTAMVAGSEACDCVSLARGAVGGFTTTGTAGGTTETAGRGAAVVAGAFATTGPVGGRLAMARGAGGAATMGGAGLAAGTILRGSGRTVPGAGGGATATGACMAGTLGAATGAGFEGTGTFRASSSLSCFLARIAFAASPGLEMCEKSNFCAIPPCPVRDAELLAWLAALLCLNCSRTFSASSASSELE